MKAKKHMVYGKAVTYEQVADMLGMNVQSLRTLCKKKTGGNLESYLNGRGIGKERFSEMLSGTMIAEDVAETEDAKTGTHPDGENDKAVEAIMNAIFGDQKKEEEKMDEDKKTANESDTETETETNVNDVENAHERIRLIYLNELIGYVDGIPEIISNAPNGNDELKEEIQNAGVKLVALLEEFRLERYSKAIDWNSIAETMKQFPDIWRGNNA